MARKTCETRLKIILAEACDYSLEIEFELMSMDAGAVLMAGMAHKSMRGLTGGILMWPRVFGNRTGICCSHAGQRKGLATESLPTWSNADRSNSQHKRQNQLTNNTVSFTIRLDFACMRV